MCMNVCVCVCTCMHVCVHKHVYLRESGRVAILDGWDTDQGATTSFSPILELGLRGGLLGSPKLLLKGPSEGGS